MKVKVNFEDFVVLINPTAHLKLRYYMEESEGEISGIGKVSKISGTRFRIEDIFLLEQQSSFSSTELSSETVAKFVEKYIQDGGNPAELKLWWHSHGNLEVFWSAADEETARMFKNDFTISIVGNKRGERLCRIDFWHPIGFTLDEVPLRLDIPDDPALRERVRKEVKEKVRGYRYPRIWLGLGRGYPYHLYPDHNENEEEIENEREISEGKRRRR